TAFVFLLIGLPYWIVLGCLSGIVSTIPYLGLVLVLLPPLIVGLITFDSGAPIAVIAASVTGFHVVAANLLIPKLVGKGVQLNPVASTVSIMFFGWMWGGMGLILGIPIVAVLKTVLENMEPTRKLGQWLGD
ncbi:MAG: AI-2E family transporter, partial [Deltaproteobacteria bacterium]|nr:AI-2E family transporter [Deltaproteobacteria bacterium]